MSEKEISTSRKIWKHFLRRLLAGIAAIVPLGVTFLVLRFFFRFTDNILGPTIAEYYGLKIPGLGFILLILLLYFLGLLATNIFGKKLIEKIEHFFLKIPVVKTVYNIAKQIMDSFSNQEKTAFQKVVLVNFLGTDVRALGFVTGSSLDKDNTKWFHVFIPTTPNPTGGLIQLIKEERMTETKLSVEDGLKLILSGGVISPGKIE
jgi:uncharacterized membrane protein